MGGNVNTLTFHSLLKPTIIEGFASVFVAGANFEDSSAYLLWKQQGVRWKKIAPLLINSDLMSIQMAISPQYIMRWRSHGQLTRAITQ